MNRVQRVQTAATNDRVGYCLGIVDLFLSKAVAARDKDREFCMALLEHRYLASGQALELVAAMPLDEGRQRHLRATIRRWAKAVGGIDDGV